MSEINLIRNKPYHVMNSSNEMQYTDSQTHKWWVWFWKYPKHV